MVSAMQRRCRRRRSIFALGIFYVLTASSTALLAETVARSGDGWLERVNGYPVLHLLGTPHQMGYQHGALLKDHVRQNVKFMIDELRNTSLVKLGSFEITAYSLIRSIVEMQREHLPQEYFDELAGLAAGAEISIEDLHVCNFIPELFHCSGFAIMNSATENGALYHGRVLDYAINWRLQEHAVLMVCQPKDAIPFVNISYAAFIGSVTGMNAEKVSIGEMGGGGWGFWNGVPMSALVRQVLQQAHTLDEAIAIMRDQPRTCQYFYVLADAKTNRAVGMEASWNRFELVWPGESNEFLPDAVEDCVLLSAGTRYKTLVQRVRQGHGKFSAKSAMRLMDRPVALQSNLHNVLFEPEHLRLWVANATSDRRPAAEQPYAEFDFGALLKGQPDPNAINIQ